MHRIVVIGPPGSGKSTFAARLGGLLAIEVFHLDELYWRGGDPPSAREWEAHERAIVERDRWIIDGNYSATLPPRLEACDAAVFLDYPTVVCAARFVRRRIAHGGGRVPGMAPQRRPYVDLGVLRAIGRFRSDHRPWFHELLAAHATGRRILVLRRPGEAERLLADVARERRAEGLHRSRSRRS
jgi:adenylate kinase family enzyme